MSNATPDAIRTRTCADILPSAIHWLWKPFLARGRLTVLDGDPNLGKSLLTVDLAARLSRGGPLPDGQPLDAPLTTVLLNAEDDPADTVRPRVVAAGADLARVAVADFSKSGPPELPECAERVFDLVCDHKADLLVIDPLSAFLPRRIANSDDRVRRALAPLAGVAAETGCAVLVVRHLGRSVGPNAVFRGGGVGVLGVALTGLLLARHPEEPDLRVLAMTKTHLGPPPAALGFRFAATDAGPALQWAVPVDLSADELCVSQSAQAVRRPRERAAEFLRAALAAGPRAVAELEKLAAERGLSWRTLERVKRSTGVVAEQSRNENPPRWLWRLPSYEADGDALRCATLRALFQLPKQIRAMHELQREGDETDRARRMATDRKKRDAPEG